MIKDKYQSTPIFGFIPKDRKRFSDEDLFGDDLWKYVILKKVKLWFGSPKSGDENVKEKSVLGIQCVYQDIVSGNISTTEQHCGDISKDDVEIQELILEDKDYICEFNLDFESSITHIKFVTKSGKKIEVGREKDDTKKTIDLNDKNGSYMVQTFSGYYNDYGLRALGCKYLLFRDFSFLNLIGILRVITIIGNYMP